MKTQLFTILAVLFALQINAQEYYAFGGPTISAANKSKWHEHFGYYAGAGISNKISEKVGYFAEGQFVNQRSGSENNHSLFAVFGFKLPVRHRLNSDIGFQIGDGMFGVLGLNYEWLKHNRIKFIARYNHRLSKSDSVFKGYGQLGASFRLKK